MKEYIFAHRHTDSEIKVKATNEIDALQILFCIASDTTQWVLKY